MNTQNYFKSLFILLLLNFTAYAFSEDPRNAGPYQTDSDEYEDSAYNGPGFKKPSEIRGSVYYPANMANKKFPLVMILHGRHVPCFAPSTGDVPARGSWLWPCPSSFPAAIPSYKGYNYLAENLASHGYIVVSISANSISTWDNDSTNIDDDRGTYVRSELIKYHLHLWKSINAGTNSLFGNIFEDKIDMNNIGLVGHSRGGEGIAQFYIDNKATVSPFGIRALMLLAPANIFRIPLKEVSLGVVLPYCDGDLRDLQGIHYFDDVLYSSNNDRSNKHSFLAMGANHSYFNTYWTPGEFNPGSEDDWARHDSHLIDSHCGSSSSLRLDGTDQREMTLSYVNSFFRAYLGGETHLIPILTGDSKIAGLNAEVHASFMPSKHQRIDINRFDHEMNTANNNLGGHAYAYGMSQHNICGDDPSEYHCIPGLYTNFPGDAPQQPHSTKSWNAWDQLGLSQLLLGWSSSVANYRNTIPSNYRDISEYETLQFRAGVHFLDSPSDEPQDFSVQLGSASGLSNFVRVSDHSDALFFPPGNTPVVTPKLLLNTVRIPLDAFTGVSLTDIREVRFAMNETVSGTISISDLVFTKNANVVTPQWTEWLNKDLPGGTGDYENRSGFPLSEVCKFPSDIQARVSGTSTIYTSQNPPSQNLSSFSPQAGLVCLQNQNYGNCRDYEVRFLCLFNKAQNATVTASSTYPYYSVNQITDRNRSTDLGPGYSWTNASNTNNQELVFQWSSAESISKIDVYTTASYPIRDYDVYFRDNGWNLLYSVTGNTDSLISNSFSAVKTDAIKIITRSGPSWQAQHSRLNEVEIY